MNKEREAGVPRVTSATAVAALTGGTEYLLYEIDGWRRLGRVGKSIQAAAEGGEQDVA